MAVNNIIFIYYLCIGAGIGIILFKNNYFYLVLGIEIIINSIGGMLLFSGAYFQSPKLFLYLLFLYIVASYEVAILFIIFFIDRKKQAIENLDWYNKVKENNV
jgi:NADH:ubiquinone oxidoreductase subunit K